MVLLYPFLGEGSPTKIDYRKKGALIPTSLLENLDILVDSTSHAIYKKEGWVLPAAFPSDQIAASACPTRSCPRLHAHAQMPSCTGHPHFVWVKTGHCRSQMGVFKRLKSFFVRARTARFCLVFWSSGCRTTSSWVLVLVALLTCLKGFGSSIPVTKESADC